MAASARARRATGAERAAAALHLKLLAQEPGPTPVRRVSWREEGAMRPFPVTDEEVSADDMRRLVKYARYNASDKGRARAAKYSQSPQRRAALWREYTKRLQARCDSAPARLAMLEARLAALGGWPTITRTEARTGARQKQEA
jgi:hypothetical protein